MYMCIHANFIFMCLSLYFKQNSTFKLVVEMFLANPIYNIRLKKEIYLQFIIKVI